MIRERLAGGWLNSAYRGAPWLIVLRPLEWFYLWLLGRRTRAYRCGRKTVWKATVPVIVVGNITLGGTGKSPLVAWLATRLKERGWQPGIVTRGYGGRGAVHPLRVTAETPVIESGDEPRMLQDQTGLPLVADPDRPRGAGCLIDEGCDILISDDGLQHLPLGRDIELVVVDGRRGWGNGRCLPAGPLREPLSRLDTVDAVVFNGEPAFTSPRGAYSMTLAPAGWRHLGSGDCVPLWPLPFDGPVHAVAGIGNPERFFSTLEELGVDVMAHSFGDHHAFRRTDLVFEDSRPVVMTAKDAVKCRDLALDDAWVLEVEAVPDDAFQRWLAERIHRFGPPAMVSGGTPGR
jgi:tetraacyldisaccharide 4'-kinase